MILESRVQTLLSHASERNRSVTLSAHFSVIFVLALWRIACIRIGQSPPVVRESRLSGGFRRPIRSGA
jgi:hypothetical protein